MKGILLRLKKISGQINGLQRMIEEEENCEKIIIQFQAVKAALESAYSESLNSNLQECLRNTDQDKMQKLIALVCKK